MQWRRSVDASRGGWRPRTILVVVVAAVTGACASPGDPPVAALGPPVAPAPGGEATPGAVDICDLARDPEVVADVGRWAGYIPALEAALPTEVDVASALGGLAPQTPVTPTVAAGLDLVWDLVDERCRQDPSIEQCRSLIALALADPVGWAVRAPDAVEVEAAFRLAAANWSELRQRVEGDALRRAVDANLEFVVAASELLEAVGWGPGQVEVLEPLADQLVALGAPDVVEPLRQLELGCGFG